MMFAFDSGTLFGIAADGTPVAFGGLQKVKVDLDFGDPVIASTQYQFPVKLAAGNGSIKGVAEFANLNGFLVASLFFGTTPSAGSLLSSSRSASIPSSGPYTLAATLAAGQTFYLDCGVVFTDTCTPAYYNAAVGAGQYSMAGGVYTFNVADKGRPVKISYLVSVVTGKMFTIANPLSYVLPTFKAVLLGTYNGKQITLILNKVVAKLQTLNFVLEDWSVNGFEFLAESDDSLNLGAFSFSE